MNPHRPGYRRTAALLAAALFIGCVSAPAAAYELQIVAQVGDVIDGYHIDRFSHEYTNVAINNDGEVAFFAGATGPSGTGYSVLTQRRFIAGAGKIVDGTVPRFNDEDHQVDINSSGQVVYTAFLPQGGRGLFVNEDMILARGGIIDGRTLESIAREAQINDAGEIVFEARYFGHFGAVIFSQTRLLAEYGQTLDGFTLGDMGFARIGNGGQVAFFGGLIEVNSWGIVSPNGAVRSIGDVVDGGAVDLVTGLSGITDAGEIVMTVRVGPWPNGRLLATTQDRILFRPGDVIDGHRVSWLASANVVLNNRGDVALLGTIPALEGSGLRYGLFAGDKLIAAEGDVLGDKVIASFFENFDMNDRGDVAFRVEFQDGSRAVVLATVPEPTSQALLIMALVTTYLWQRRNPTIQRRVSDAKSILVLHSTGGSSSCCRCLVSGEIVNRFDRL